MRIKRIKVDDNLYLVGSEYFFRRGDFERKLNTTVLKEAKRKRDLILEELEPFGSMLPYKIKIKDTHEEHLKERRKEVKLGKIRQSTFDETEWIWETYLLDRLKNKSPIEITSLYFTKMLAGIKVNDFTNIRKVLGTHLRWCCTRGYLNAVPLLKIPHHEKRQRRVLKPQEIITIFSHAHGSFLLFLSLALFQGMRRSEIIKLKWKESLDLVEGVIRLYSHETKTGKGRAMPINKNAMALLMARFENRINSPWVFPNKTDPRRHMSLSGFKGSWKRCLKNAGMENEDITWHDFRATFETMAHRRTDLSDTQLEKFAGASIDVQRKIYVQMDANDLRGVEETVQIPALNLILEKNQDFDSSTGLVRDEKKVKQTERAATNGNNKRNK